ncbi:unnamed protein product [Cylicocyclus nassatus]|uniref:Uncharacterized protein n=1 Tax=Cylicocyclus nassatus TaxID=53992 RepID=A0AA36H3G0_CYLNA|nr:unnamed protein product [Cylicocyclus nassatus]
MSLSRLRYFDSGYYRATLGRSYYIDDVYDNENPCHMLEEAKRTNRNRVTFRLEAGTDDHHQKCMRYSLMFFFISLGLIAAYLTWVAMTSNFNFSFFDAVVLAVLIISILGATATYYKNAYLLGLTCAILTCTATFFVTFLVLATYLYTANEKKFRELVPVAHNLFGEDTATSTQFSKDYMAVVAFCIVHAMAFFIMAFLCWRIRVQTV